MTVLDRPLSLWAMGLLCWAASGSFQSLASQAPWETWQDLHRLAVIEPGGEAGLRSSYCPSGCRYDRHSADDSRVLGRDGDEAVLFEQVGAGAITRIWMTTGRGVSRPLPSSVRLRLYVDSDEPVLDLPLPELFAGGHPPFVEPLVGDRLTSSGGNFSYVPIPYRRSCRLTLVGADHVTLWYQIGYTRLDDDELEASVGAEDVGGLSRLLRRRGEDPWQQGDRGPLKLGRAALEPGKTTRIAELVGPDSITALRFLPEAPGWREVELLMAFDGAEGVRMSLADFFAVGRSGATPTRSLLVGTDDEGWLYTYFPMPFYDQAFVALTNRGEGSPTIQYLIRRAGRAPQAGSGLFAAQLAVDRETPIGRDIPLLSVSGAGKWVGLFAELGSVKSGSRAYLEGDEHVFVDGATEPALHGTGTEDFFNGGFYFDHGPFQLALHGAPYHLRENGEDVTAAYRLLLTDAVSFSSSLRVSLEGGPTNNLSLRRRTVAYYYFEERES